MRLGLKFNLILTACFLVGLMASAILFYQISQRNAQEQLRGQIEVLRAQALSVRRYTSEEIRPLLANLSAVQFIPQTVPSFSAQAVFANFRDRFPSFSYKEAVLNPTNPADLAVGFEKEMIDKLRADSSIKSLVEVRQDPAGPQYTVAFPLVVGSESCLTCHSTPENAPPSLIALYGKEGGLGWKLNETIGAQIFSVPLAEADKAIWQNLWIMLAFMSAIFLTLLVLLNVLLHRFVIAPVAQIASVAERVSMGDSSVPEYVHEGGDEIASLSKSFNRMRRSLDNAMKMLDT